MPGRTHRNPSVSVFVADLHSQRGSGLETASGGWQDAAMDTDNAEHEARALEEVVERLVTRFPDVAEDRVREIVRAAHEEFANRPIRDFVPVFVERAARNELGRLTTE
jgi:hypothetical protein